MFQFVMKTLVLFAAVSLFAACTSSIRPIYYDREQAKAERKVIQFHNLYNEGNLEGIYALLDDAARTSLPKDQFLVASKETFDKWGKVQSATLVRAKVYPVSPIQVKFIYNVKFEKGDGQEWFTWNIYGDDARLLQYQSAPGFAKPDSEK